MTKRTTLHVLAAAFVASAVLMASGCTSTPISLAVSLAGTAVNDADVKEKAGTLMGASSSQCDAALGQPVNVYGSDQPARQWRIYPVKYDVIGNYRYVVELARDQVIAVSKAQRNNEIAIDIATDTYFKDKCMGKSPQACQEAVGKGSPALSVRNAATGQLVQLYDARLVKEVQKPYYALLWFGPDGNCSKISVMTIAASTKKNPAVQ